MTACSDEARAAPSDALASRLQLPERVGVTGLALDPVDREQLFAYALAASTRRSDDLADATESAADERLPAQRTIGYLNVHVANTAAGDAQLRGYVNESCDLVYCDGRGVGWGARLAGHAEPPRMTAADWLPELLAAFRDVGRRVFVVAGKPGVVDTALDAIGRLVGPLGPVATHDGYLANDPAKTAALLDRIREFDADVVLVGMGTPTQEHWTREHRAAIAAPLVWTLGATFDYYAGEQARGPEWLRRAGHEWAARLLADPARLWRRYVLGNPAFLARAACRRLLDGPRAMPPKAPGSTPHKSP